MSVLAYYTKARKVTVHTHITGTRVYQSPASNALREARIRQEWFDAVEDSEELGAVRLRVVPDDCVSFDDLEGDTYNPKVNSDIPRARLEREQKEFRARVSHDGVWGLVGEFYDGHQWQHVDSCFGFVGDDWKDSGYDLDIMRATLDAAKNIEFCPTCGQILPKGKN